MILIGCVSRLVLVTVVLTDQCAKSLAADESVIDIVGQSLDIFANYGDLGQMMQVVSGDFDDEIPPLFTERTMRIFDDVHYDHNTKDHVDDSLTFLFCDTFDDLMRNYFKNFAIQGSSKPWKAFMGDWLQDEILRGLGIVYDASIGLDGYCCFVLTRITKTYTTVSLTGAQQNYALTNQLTRAADSVNGDEIDIRKFMRSYGTHYIDSFSTGNSVYQVFVYSRQAYRILKREMKHRRSSQLHPDDLRFYTSSYFLRQIGQVMVASGNKTIESWCEQNLRDSQYLYSRPTLLKLYNNATLYNKLSGLLDDAAILKMKLNILAPVFKDEEMRDSFVEIVDNDLKLWEVSS